MTQLFLRSICQPYTGLTADQSSTMPVGTSLAACTLTNGFGNGAPTSPFLMSETISTNPSNAVYTRNTNSTTSQQSALFGTWVSLPLSAQTIAAQTWNLGLIGTEANAAANMQFVVTIGVWRPSTAAVVGMIYDASTLLGTELGTSNSGRTFSVSGSAVTCQAGDVLFLQVWFSGTPSMSGTAYAITMTFDGSAAVTASGTTTGCFLQSTNTLTFSGSSGAGSVFYMENETPSPAPPTTAVTTDPGINTPHDTGMAVQALDRTQQAIAALLTGSNSTGATADDYMTSWSIPIGAQTLAAQKYIFNFWAAKSGTAGAFAPRLYLYRPGTGKIADLANGANWVFPSSGGEGGTTPKMHTCIFTQAASQATNDGDLLCIDLWALNDSAGETFNIRTGGSDAINGAVTASALATVPANSNATGWLQSEFAISAPAGTNNYSYTMSGGLTTGGTAARVLTAKPVVSGGLTTGGTGPNAKRTVLTTSGGLQTGGAAATLMFKQYVYAPSGGLATGGSAPMTSVAKPRMTGGLVAAGAAAIVAHAVLTASGGLTTGGHAAEAKRTTLTTSGGMTVGGTAPVQTARAYQYSPSGGLQTAGTGAVAVTMRPPATGGFTATGSAPVARTVAPPASGGLAVGGTAPVARRVSLATSGGATFAGAAPIARRVALVGSGQITFGGAAATGSGGSTNFPYVGSGGTTFGGSAPVARSIAITTTGGLTVGGAAPESRTVSLTGTGGLALTGAAALSYGVVVTPVGGALFGGAATVLGPQPLVPLWLYTFTLRGAAVWALEWRAGPTPSVTLATSGPSFTVQSRGTRGTS